MGLPFVWKAECRACQSFPTLEQKDPGVGKADDTHVWTRISSCTSEEDGQKAAGDQGDPTVDQELNQVAPPREASRQEERGRGF